MAQDFEYVMLSPVVLTRANGRSAQVDITRLSRMACSDMRMMNVKIGSFLRAPSSTIMMAVVVAVKERDHGADPVK
jgi:hypothetical protein